MKHGSFSQTVKEEITSFEYTNEQYLALLSGFIKTNGVVSISSKKMTLSLQTENEAEFSVSFVLLLQKFLSVKSVGFCELPL